MANKKKNKNNSVNTKSNDKKNNKISENNNTQQKSLLSKFLLFLGVIVLFCVIVYLMYYFFVEKSYIKINMSTDKKLDFLAVNNDEELITTQKYISDLGYSMRYDIENFTVFKYKLQDIYKYKGEEQILLVVEETLLPGTCTNGSLDVIYNNCYVKLDDYTEQYYISTNGKTFRVSIKTSNKISYDASLKTRIDYMLNSFEMK